MLNLEFFKTRRCLISRRVHLCPENVHRISREIFVTNFSTTFFWLQAATYQKVTLVRFNIHQNYSVKLLRIAFSEILKKEEITCISHSIIDTASCGLVFNTSNSYILDVTLNFHYFNITVFKSFLLRTAIKIQDVYHKMHFQ